DVLIGRDDLAGLELSLVRKRYVDSHLVAVEVGVESATDERVHLDGVTLDEDRAEGLDTLAVQGRSTVQEHVLVHDDVLQDGPYLRHAVLDEAAGAADVVCQFLAEKLGDDERAEELE